MQPHGHPVIRIRDLRKRYDKNEVLHGIDLDVYSGQIIGYIGPNGAGKSTTVRILAGLDGSYEGQVEVAGFDLKKDNIEVKKIMGYVPENAELYDVLTPMEFLLLAGRLHHLSDEVISERATQMLQYFGLGDNLHQRMDTFSKGMRQKVLLISGLLHNPQIIFLDEPLSGLDANAVILVKEIISKLAAEGKTIFYCSHMMDVVEKISHRIILIADGTIIADGPIETLRSREGESLEHIFSQLTGGQDFDRMADDFLSAFKPNS
ncbi:MAG: ABC transporter ATP-binding protein [Saprospiraceae bacterium]|nr:ABC transporter ATP-binding protein [Saprospiraceae bacterium]